MNEPELLMEIKQEPVEAEEDAGESSGEGAEDENDDEEEAGGGGEAASAVGSRSGPAGEGNHENKDEVEEVEEHVDSPPERRVQPRRANPNKKMSWKEVIEVALP